MIARRIRMILSYHTNESKVCAKRGRTELIRKTVRPLYSKKEKGPRKGALFHLVAGARLSNYMQIEIEPFPMLA